MEDQGVVGNLAVGPQAPTAPDAHVYGHRPFQGIHRLKLEPNGRVALPAAYKAAFDHLGVLRPHRTEHLALYTQRGWEETVKEFVASTPGGVLHPRARKRLHMSVTEVTLDKQSRFVIPPELKERAGLGERIVLAGSIESIEIWSEEAFEAEAATLDDGDLFFDGFEGL